MASLVADGIDNSHHLVSRHARILNTGPEPFFDNESLWQMPHASTLIRTVPGCGSGDISFNQF